MKQQLKQEAQIIAVKHLEAWKMYDMDKGDTTKNELYTL